jgi:hypothetical protein
MAASTIAGRPFQTALTLGQIFLPTRTIPRRSSTTAPIASNISTREGSAPTLRQRCASFNAVRASKLCIIGTSSATDLRMLRKRADIAYG